MPCPVLAYRRVVLLAYAMAGYAGTRSSTDMGYTGTRSQVLALIRRLASMEHVRYYLPYAPTRFLCDVRYRHGLSPYACPVLTLAVRYGPTRSLCAVRSSYSAATHPTGAVGQGGQVCSTVLAYGARQCAVLSERVVGRRGSAAKASVQS
eukprot:2070611-Rhodomonas_salina.1